MVARSVGKLGSKDGKGGDDICVTFRYEAEKVNTGPGDQTDDQTCETPMVIALFECRTKELQCCGGNQVAKDDPVVFFTKEKVASVGAGGVGCTSGWGSHTASCT